MKKGRTRSGASSPSIQIPLDFPEGIPNFEPRNVRITERAPIVRFNRDRGTAELVERRWSWPAPGGKPVFNMRSDGREFGRDRCLVMADGFYEFTITRRSQAEAQGLLAFPPGRRRAVRHRRRGAERCERGRGVHLAHCSARADIAPYHNRQIALLAPPHWRAWLDGSVSSKELLRPAEAGGLSVAPMAA